MPNINQKYMALYGELENAEPEVLTAWINTNIIKDPKHFIYSMNDRKGWEILSSALTYPKMLEEIIFSNKYDYFTPDDGYFYYSPNQEVFHSFMLKSDIWEYFEKAIERKLNNPKTTIEWL